MPKCKPTPRLNTLNPGCILLPGCSGASVAIVLHVFYTNSTYLTRWYNKISNYSAIFCCDHCAVLWGSITPQLDENWCMWAHDELAQFGIKTFQLFFMIRRKRDVGLQALTGSLYETKSHWPVLTKWLVRSLILFSKKTRWEPKIKGTFFKTTHVIEFI